MPLAIMPAAPLPDTGALSPPLPAAAPALDAVCMPPAPALGAAEPPTAVTLGAAAPARGVALALPATGALLCPAVALPLLPPAAEVAADGAAPVPALLAVIGAAGLLLAGAPLCPLDVGWPICALPLSLEQPPAIRKTPSASAHDARRELKSGEQRQ